MRPKKESSPSTDPKISNEGERFARQILGLSKSQACLRTEIHNIKDSIAQLQEDVVIIKNELIIKEMTDQEIDYFINPLSTEIIDNMATEMPTNPLPQGVLPDGEIWAFSPYFIIKFN